MIVFRLCENSEIENLIIYRTPKALGHICKNDSIKNNHQYTQGVRYMHFFDDETSILYLSPRKGENICVYDIPKDILEEAKGCGNYADFINLETIQKIPEYAIPSNKMKSEYLKQIYLITEDMDFDYYPEKDEIYSSLSCMVDLTKRKEQPKECDASEKGLKNKRIFTGNYEECKAGNLISISGDKGKSVGFIGRTMTELAPKKDFWRIWHANIGKIPEEENTRYYIEQYYEKVLSKVNIEKLLKDEKDPILLCYEKGQDFCHRHVLAEFIELTYGIKVRDIKIDENLKIEENARPEYIRKMLKEVMEKELER